MTKPVLGRKGSRDKVGASIAERVAEEKRRRPTTLTTRSAVHVDYLLSESDGALQASQTAEELLQVRG